MTHEDIEATKAPLIEHLIELRSRLIKSAIACRIGDVGKALEARNGAVEIRTCRSAHGA